MDGDFSYWRDTGTTRLVGYWVTALPEPVRHDYWTVWDRKNPGHRRHARHSSNNPGVLHITNFYEDRVVGRLLVRVKAQTSIRGAGK